MPLNNAATEDLDTRFKWLVARTRDSVQEIKKDVSKTTQVVVIFIFSSLLFPFPPPPIILT